MRRGAPWAAALLALACSRPAAPPPGQAVYESKSGDFSLQGPSGWRVLEEQGGAHRVTLMGPLPDLETIAVYRYERSAEYPDAQAYLAGQALAGRPGPSRKMSLAGRPAWDMTVERESPPMHGAPPQRLSVRMVVVEDARGFWSLVRTGPSGQGSEKAFDQVLASFQPRPASVVR